MPHVNYFWDEIEDNVVHEYDDDSNSVANYDTEPTLHGSVLAQERYGEKRYFHFDGQENTTELTNEVGTVTDVRRYSAFGHVVETGYSSLPFEFRGERQGTSDLSPTLTMVRRRIYDNSTSRWLTLDPVEHRDGFSRYAFVWNCPIVFTDPSGQTGVLIYAPGRTYLPNCHCGNGRMYWRIRAGAGWNGGITMYVVQRLCWDIKSTKCNLECGCIPEMSPRVCKRCILELLPAEDGEFGVDTELGTKDFWNVPFIPGEVPCISKGTATMSAHVLATADKKFIEGLNWKPAGRIACGDFSINVGPHLDSVPEWFDNVILDGRWQQSASGHLATSWNCCPVDVNQREGSFAKFGAMLIVWHGADGMSADIVNCGNHFEDRA